MLFLLERYNKLKKIIKRERMNKKQKNRKLVTQNKRNRMINRRYSSTIKSLTKLFKKNINTSLVDNSKEEQTKFHGETKKIMNNLYSIIDKAVKKQVIHKNTAARKKSNLNHLSKVFNPK